MNRIELVALFTALKTRAENDDMESIKEIIYTVLDEVKYAKSQNERIHNH